MKIDIDLLSEAELVDLNHRVVERLRMLDQLRAHGQMLEFSIGDRVAFTPHGRPTVMGVVAKYNRKTVTVIAENGLRWNVAPALLRHADVVDAVTTPPTAITRNGTETPRRSFEHVAGPGTGSSCGVFGAKMCLSPSSGPSRPE